MQSCVQYLNHKYQYHVPVSHEKLHISSKISFHFSHFLPEPHKSETQARNLKMLKNKLLELRNGNRNQLHVN